MTRFLLAILIAIVPAVGACNKDTKYVDDREYCSKTSDLKLDGDTLFVCESQWVGSGRANFEVRSSKERVWVETDFVCPESFKPQTRYQYANCVNSIGDVTFGTSTYPIRSRVFCGEEHTDKWLRSIPTKSSLIEEGRDFIFQCNPHHFFVGPGEAGLDYILEDVGDYFECRHKTILADDRSAIFCERVDSEFTTNKEPLENNVAGVAGCKKDDDQFTSANGGCRDLTTGLVWGGDGTFVPPSLQAAYDFCNNFESSGYLDWRLPTQVELEYVALQAMARDHFNINLGAKAYRDRIHFLGANPIDATDRKPVAQSLLDYRYTRKINDRLEGKISFVEALVPLRVICVR